MLLKKEYSMDEIYNRVVDYFETYDDLKDEEVIKKMIENVPSGLYFDYAPYYVEQLYYEYDMFSAKKNIYKEFRELLGMIYEDIEKRKILEVGGGYVPQLGKEIAKISKEDVLVFDKTVSLKNNSYSNLILFNEDFNEQTDIRDRDLIVGLRPCEASASLVKIACENQKDFIIGLCGCEHNETINKFAWNKKSYLSNFLDYINFMANEYNVDIKGGKVLDIPVVYSKRG